MKGTIKSIRKNILKNDENLMINSLKKTNKKYGSVLKRLGE
jgi:hypothetical protein